MIKKQLAKWILIVGIICSSFAIAQAAEARVRVHVFIGGPQYVQPYYYNYGPYYSPYYYGPYPSYGPSYYPYPNRVYYYNYYRHRHHHGCFRCGYRW